MICISAYRDMFLRAGLDKWVPEGVRTAWATDYVDRVQQKMDGYDADHWMDMQLTLPGFGFDNDHARRSYAALFITRQVDKLG